MVVVSLSCLVFIIWVIDYFLTRIFSNGMISSSIVFILFMVKSGIVCLKNIGNIIR